MALAAYSLRLCKSNCLNKNGLLSRDSRRVSVVLDSEAEMPLFRISGALKDILARSDQFN